MSNDLQILQDTKEICRLLLETPHYKKMGVEGIFAIVDMCRSLGISHQQGLNGGLFYMQGRISMSAALMNCLIRKERHSIIIDPSSDNSMYTLHGRRCDTGDTCTATFSIDDAKRAGIYANQWLKYPKAMLFARALSILARQLFPDVIQGLYVEGEIPEKEEKFPNDEPKRSRPKTESIDSYISKEKADSIIENTKDFPEVQQKLLEICNISSLYEIKESQLPACRIFFSKNCKKKNLPVEAKNKTDDQFFDDLEQQVV